MPPSPLDERIVGVVALPRPVRPQELRLRLDAAAYVASPPPGASRAAGEPRARSPTLSPAAAAALPFRGGNFTYMPSSSGSVRSLSCGCSGASCCTVTTYQSKGEQQSPASAGGGGNLLPAPAAKPGTPANCPSCAAASPMVSSSENGGALSPPASAAAAGAAVPLSPPAAAATKPVAGVRTIHPAELAKKLSRCSKGPPSQSQGPVIIDCRPFMEYNRSHIQGAVHINCSDKISRRRLQQGKITVLDLISCREGKDSYKRIFSKEIIVYDENTNEPNRVMPSLPLHIVLESLRREGKDPLVLKGGHSSFKQHHENLCDHSLQLQECPDTGTASAIPTQLPQSIPTTPDIENAQLTPILPFLFLGNEQDAQDIEKMQRMNVGYIINVTTHLPLYHYEQGIFRYKRLPATDSNKQNLRQYFEEAFEFIEEAHQCGKGLLIHCQAGVSRSATIVIAYLMKHTLMTMTDAYKFVKGKRPIISPNLNFMGQLLEFEEDLNNGVTPRILTPKRIGVETIV
ncbi:dual specificity protein phosphatase 10 [Scyliorhinus canicula]|uniref:dual specificity protein phosphatase 10 n=1 Tax=Scyliorhinus canicula TaxID=7830 RepID=UPI0018F4F900|nr:dual specificity protein phosphatase 10 [Scyliorhinus canicula]